MTKPMGRTSYKRHTNWVTGLLLTAVISVFGLFANAHADGEEIDLNQILSSEITTLNELTQ